MDDELRIAMRRAELREQKREEWKILIQIATMAILAGSFVCWILYAPDWFWKWFGL